MTKLIETTQAVDEAYLNVKAKHSTSGVQDIVSYWLKIREDYHYLGDYLFTELNTKIIRENGNQINS